MKNVFAGLVLGVVWIASGCATVAKDAQNPIIFAHHLHTEQGLGCGDCHTPGGESRLARMAVPQKPECAGCHDVESEETCATCHADPGDPRSFELREKRIVFSHTEHEEYGAACEDCHDGAAHWPVGHEGAGLGHDDCRECHGDDFEKNRCAMCHERLAAENRAPVDVYDHGPGFMDRHGLEAKGGQDVCLSCHEQSDCADCHSRTRGVRPSVRNPEEIGRTFMHQGDWMSRHAIESRVGDSSCLKCHDNAYCSSCHERSGVGAGRSGASPHPSEWVAAGNALSHGRAARRRITECAACHDQGPASNCLECHSPLGGHQARNPHPPGWDPPVPRSQASSHEMCSICHVN